MAAIKRKKTSKPKAEKKCKVKTRAKRVLAKRPRTKVANAKTKGAQLEKVGKVTHYFPHVKAAAVLTLKDGLKIGDRVYIKGHTTDFKQSAKSMQLDHVPIQEAKKDQEIGLLVKSRVRIGDTVYRIGKA